MASSAEQAILDFIGQVESGGNYDAYHTNSRSTTDLSKLTLAEIQKYQKELGDNTGSSTVGRYQFSEATTKWLMDTLKLKPTDKFTRELQDKMAVALMKRRGYDDYVAGKIDEDQFLNNLAKEWAGLPVASGEGAGKSYWEGKTGEVKNKAGVSVAQARSVLQGSLGYTPSARGSGKRSGTEAAPTPRQRPSDSIKVLTEVGTTRQRKALAGRWGSLLGGAAYRPPTQDPYTPPTNNPNPPDEPTTPPTPRPRPDPDIPVVPPVPHPYPDWRDQPTTPIPPVPHPRPPELTPLPYPMPQPQPRLPEDTKLPYPMPQPHPYPVKPGEPLSRTINDDYYVQTPDGRSVNQGRIVPDGGWPAGAPTLPPGVTMTEGPPGPGYTYTSGVKTDRGVLPPPAMPSWGAPMPMPTIGGAVAGGGAVPAVPLNPYDFDKGVLNGYREIQEMGPRTTGYENYPAAPNSGPPGVTKLAGAAGGYTFANTVGGGAASYTPPAEWVPRAPAPLTPRTTPPIAPLNQPGGLAQAVGGGVGGYTPPVTPAAAPRSAPKTSDPNFFQWVGSAFLANNPTLPLDPRAGKDQSQLPGANGWTAADANDYSSYYTPPPAAPAPTSGVGTSVLAPPTPVKTVPIDPTTGQPILTPDQQAQAQALTADWLANMGAAAASPATPTAFAAPAAGVAPPPSAPLTPPPAPPPPAAPVSMASAAPAAAAAAPPPAPVAEPAPQVPQDAWVQSTAGADSYAGIYAAPAASPAAAVGAAAASAPVSSAYDAWVTSSAPMPVAPTPSPMAAPVSAPAAAAVGAAAASVGAVAKAAPAAAAAKPKKSYNSSSDTYVPPQSVSTASKSAGGAASSAPKSSTPSKAVSTVSKAASGAAPKTTGSVSNASKSASSAAPKPTTYYNSGRY